MTNTEAKKQALNTIMESVGTAYYKICDNNDYPEQDAKLIMDYINKYGKRIAKALNTEYVTY